MSLDYIIRRVESESGYTDSREYLVDKVNEACREIYTKRDLPISLQEIFIKANSNAELALPPFVGELRAIRSTQWNDRWDLTDLRPRYNSCEWPHIWKSWRIKCYAPTKVESNNIAPVTLTIAVADSTLQVTIAGETLDSSNEFEVITMDAIEKEGTKNFTTIRSIKKNKINNKNVVVHDADDVEIATIYADQYDARYVVVDVSEYPDLQTCPDGTYTMEVLYKPRLNRLENDHDVFPVDGMDDMIVLKTLELLESGKEGKEQRAILMHQKNEQMIKDFMNDRNGTLSKAIGFKRNPMLGIFKRYY